jgi:hypothetical protein
MGRGYRRGVYVWTIAETDRRVRYGTTPAPTPTPPTPTPTPTPSLTPTPSPIPVPTPTPTPPLTHTVAPVIVLSGRFRRQVLMKQKFHFLGTEQLCLFCTVTTTATTTALTTATNTFFWPYSTVCWFLWPHAMPEPVPTLVWLLCDEMAQVCWTFGRKLRVDCIWVSGIPTLICTPDSTSRRPHYTCAPAADYLSVLVQCVQSVWIQCYSLLCDCYYHRYYCCCYYCCSLYGVFYYY